MQRSSRPARLALATIVVALAGVAVSAETYVLHGKLAADAGFASFCNVNDVVNCDVVLTSQYAKFLGVPVAAWGALFYFGVAGLAGLVWRGTRASASAAAARTGRRAASWIQAAAIGGLAFSAYMAVIAFFVIRAVCLMCSALYLVAVGLFVTAWMLRSAGGAPVRTQAAARPRGDRWVVWGAAAVAGAVLTVAGWEALGPGASAIDGANEIAKQRPDFYRWYLGLPIVSVPAGDGNEIGPATAPVTVVAYSDFECGHCAALASSLRETRTRFRDQVRVIFRHFPLDPACNPGVSTNLHSRACRAAAAAECAAEQQRFWPYHDLLFANQKHLAEADLLAYAQRVGLDRAQFEACLASPAASARVGADVRGGVQLGIESTPTLFINGRVVRGTLAPELMSYAVRLAQATARAQR